MSRLRTVTGTGERHDLAPWLAPAKFVAPILLLKLALDLGYAGFVGRTYQYAGFVLQASSSRIAISYAVASVLAYAVAQCARQPRPSSVGIIVILCMLVLPLLTYWAMAGGGTQAVILFVFSYVATIAIVAAPLPALPAPRLSASLPLILAVSIVGLAMAMLLAHGGAGHFNLDFEKIYDTRAAVYSEIVTGPIAYLTKWAAKCANVVLLCYALWKRNVLLFAAALLVQLLFFGILNNKEYLFYPLIAALFFFEGRLRMRAPMTIAWVMAFLCAASYVHFVVTQSYGLAAVVIMRTFFSQALNSFEYFEFFQDHPFVHWSNSILSGLSDYPYDSPIPTIIGADRYGEGSEAFANTGYLGSGYMQMGTLGTLINGCLAGGILKLFDLACGRRLPLLFGGTLSFIAATELIQADATIAFFSGGIFLSLVLCYGLRYSIDRPRQARSMVIG